MRISDWSSDVCSCDRRWHSSWPRERACCAAHERPAARASLRPSVVRLESPLTLELLRLLDGTRDRAALLAALAARMANDIALIPPDEPARPATRSEEHTSELQSLMRTSYAVFCLKKKKLALNKKQPITTVQN